MSLTFNRIERINDLLQITLARLIQQQMQDPRVKMVTVTGVSVSCDLAHAKIYFTICDEITNEASTLLALQNAATFLRKRLSQEVALRRVPKLHFYYDNTLNHAKRMDDLLRDI